MSFFNYMPRAVYNYTYWDALNIHAAHIRQERARFSLRFQAYRDAEWREAEFTSARIHGGAGDEALNGFRGVSDVFDSDGGGNDFLCGYGGNDVYYLGAGTGHDEILNSGIASDDEIRVKPGIAVSSVSLARDKYHLYVRLHDGEGVVTDSLTVEDYYSSSRSAGVKSVVFADGTVWGSAELASARIRGSAGDGRIHGLWDPNVSDFFDGDAGGNDYLYGYGGNDVYYLGAGTDHDVIREYYNHSIFGDSGDEIRLESGIEASSVSLVRDKYNLYVRLHNDENVVTDSLTVENYYRYDSARVESVVFADGTVLWDAAELAAARIRGGTGDDHLFGVRSDDVFDADAGGNDYLYGYIGNDVYYLGAGTDHDVIREHYGQISDPGDEIRLESGIAVSSVSVIRDGNDLHVRLLGGADGTTVTDSLRVENHFSNGTAKVEKIRAGGKVLLESNYLSLINEVAAFNAGTSSYATMTSLLNAYWQDENTLTTTAGG